MTVVSLAEDRPIQAQRQPNAHRITSEREAIDIATELASAFAREAADRDRTRRLPYAEIDQFSESGLWAVTVTKQYGGLGLSFAKLAEIFVIISAADPSLGQLPQNHFAAIDAIRVSGSEQQQRLWFGRVLEGYRLGNAFSEANSKHVGAFTTRVTADGDGFRVTGRNSTRPGRSSPISFISEQSMITAR